MELDFSSPSISQRAMSMKMGIDVVQKSCASQQIINVLNTCNGLSTASVYNLSINLPVLVYSQRNADQSKE